MESNKKFIIDDGIDVSDHIDTILFEKGFHIISAKKGKGGKMRNEKPDLVITGVEFTCRYDGLTRAEEIGRLYLR